MKINVEEILNGVLDSNKGKLLGHSYFINDGCLYGIVHSEIYTDLLFLPECEGIEINEESIYLWQDKEIVFIIDDKGYRYPDSDKPNMHQINNKLMKLVIKMEGYNDYLKSKNRTLAENTIVLEGILEKMEARLKRYDVKE